MPTKRQPVRRHSRPPARRTRVELREETRRRLLEAGWEVFNERGFAATSVEDIVGRAGYTRGAFYSNFTDKEEIFLALMDARLEERATAIAEVMRESSPSTLFADLRVWNASTRREPMRISLLAEFRAHAVRSEAVRERLVERERAIRAAFARAIAAQFEAAGVDPPAPVEDLALIVHVLDTGLPLHRSIDPDEVRDEFLFDALALLFRAAVSLSVSSGG